MQNHQFSHEPFGDPSQPAYVVVAAKFIAEVAPSLPASVRNRVAELTVAAMFSSERTYPEALMDDPALQLCERWRWPEAEAAYPFNLGAYSLLGSFLWRGEQWSAKTDADWLMREVNSVTREDWLYSAPMTLVREWRNKLLPARAKRGTKYDLLLDLKRHPDFAGEVTREYGAWKRELVAQADALMAEALKPPVPKHLRWLVQQVMHYLDNFHTATNSRRGPGAFLARQARLLQASTQASPPLEEAALHAELEEAFSISMTFSLSGEPAVPTQLAWGYIERLRRDLSPTAIARKLEGFAPAKLICTRPCERCAAGETRKQRDLAPFDVLCRCTEFVWVSKNFKGSAHEWKYGPQVDLDATMWAFDRLFGINEEPLDRVALYVRAGIQPWEDRYQHTVGPLLKLGAKKAAQYARTSLEANVGTTF